MKRNVKRHAVVQPQDQSIKLIPLTQNQNAIVDSSDYNWLVQWNWSARWSASTRSFYADRRDYSRTPSVIIPMHRQILGLEPGNELLGDHIRCQDTLDNRRSNLRIATNEQNSQNCRIHKNNKSGFKGVRRHHNKWYAMIRVKGERIYLGLHATPELAHRAYASAAAKYHGAYAHC